MVDYQAVKWYSKAVNQNHIIANYNLGIIYEGDKDTKNNFEIVLEHYTVAAAHGHEGAQFKLGYFNYHGYGTEIDYGIALKRFSEFADQNNAVANYNLGICYDIGLCFPQDYGVAAIYFRVAANENYPDAQFKLGYYYHHGAGVELDYSKAVEWYEKASSQGHGIAKYNLKIMHLNNDGVGENPVLATQSNGFIADREENHTEEILERIIHRPGVAADQNTMGANDSLKVNDDDGRSATRYYEILFKKYKDIADHFQLTKSGFKVDHEKEIKSFTKQKAIRS